MAVNDVAVHPEVVLVEGTANGTALITVSAHDDDPGAEITMGLSESPTFAVRDRMFEFAPYSHQVIEDHLLPAANKLFVNTDQLEHMHTHHGHAIGPESIRFDAQHGSLTITTFPTPAWLRPGAVFMASSASNPGPFTVVSVNNLATSQIFVEEALFDEPPSMVTLSTQRLTSFLSAQRPTSALSTRANSMARLSG